MDKIDALVKNYKLIGEYKKNSMFKIFTKEDWVILLSKDLNYIGICNKYELKNFNDKDWSRLNFDSIEKESTRYLFLKYYYEYLVRKY